MYEIIQLQDLYINYLQLAATAARGGTGDVIKLHIETMSEFFANQCAFKMYICDLI